MGDRGVPMHVLYERRTPPIDGWRPGVMMGWRMLREDAAEAGDFGYSGDG
jgi:hypothetical protein